MAVEKLLPWKMLEKTLRYDAPQTTFSIFLDLFYPPNFRFFGENGVFQQPRWVLKKSVIGASLWLRLSLLPSFFLSLFPIRLASLVR